MPLIALRGSLRFAWIAALLLGGCATHPKPSPARADAAFFAQLQSLCGQAFAGRILADEPRPTSADPFEGKPLIAHVRECGDHEIRIPLHVGDDRSRTWVVSRTPQGLRLKHDHRHRDGSPDAVTQYGGDAIGPGMATRQEFPVDAASIATFRQAGLTASVTNVWAMELKPAALRYELTRAGRRFVLEFDLSRPLPSPPPAPWGAD